MILEQQIGLAQFSTFKIGGPARSFLVVKTIPELVEGFKLAKKKGLKVFILGGGSNILFPDAGFDGLVIKLEISDCNVDKTRLICGAGTSLQQAVDLSIKHGLAGLEWAGGLPGSVGGAVRGNAGAFGGETKDTLERVESVDSSGLVHTRTKSECQFDYRESIFKHNGEALTRVVFHLQSGEPTSLRAIADNHITYRRQRHPLEFGNAGSIFKNTPVEQLSPELRQIWQAKIKTDPFPVVPTAVIIAAAGLAGKRVGEAQVSTKHTNYIVNLGQARQRDVLGLIEIVKKIVYQKFKIKLEEEITLVS